MLTKLKYFYGKDKIIILLIGLKLVPYELSLSKNKMIYANGECHDVSTSWICSYC
ncbi:protein of unknown function [Xenorhabdus doucetiae]|uniref:Uncharacterized protein n=1 Tax=Xenorhabdus doucetiae TaxID=351671 RepID=A0A068QR36_9GAMM|nr:protein of unknown function [Xenorhabdus doucetiae]